MSSIEVSETSLPVRRSGRWAGWALAGAAAIGAVAGASYLFSPAADGLRAWLATLFALDSEQVTWFITRASGLTAYFLLWLSMAWGLAVPSRILDRVLHRAATFEFHQFISLLSLGFLAVHILVLLGDHFVTYSLAQILLPFLSTYRPFWVGIGVLSLYLMVLVTVTFYLRQRIGMRAFRVIHVFSLLAYLGATAHSVFAGTDSSLPVTLFLYIGSFLVIVFLTVYWWIMREPARQGA